MSSPLSVRVPASTSNLGPGFDCLGLGLSLWLEASARAGQGGTGSGPRIVAREGHARGWPAQDDLFLTAVARALEAGGGGPAADFSVSSEIPVGRGFGSSGAAVAAGLLLGAELARHPPPLGRLHALGVELEGHPDNVTAALFGGLTLCHPWAQDGAPLLVHEALAEELGFVLAWSDQTLATSRARAVLPATVAFPDAVENARRLPLLLAGLRTADRELVRAGGEDRLHVRYRLPLIAGGAAALAAAREAGAWLATVSGAGSGLVAIGEPAACPAIAAALRTELERAASGATARVVEPVRTASQVVRGSAPP